MYFLSDILPLRTHTSAVIFGIYKLSLVSFSPMQTCHPSSPFAEALECRGQWEDGFQSPWSHTAAVSHKASCRKCFPTQERGSYICSVTFRKRERRKWILRKMVLEIRDQRVSVGKITFVTGWVWATSWEMRSPGDRGLELRPVWLERHRCWESSVLRGQLSGRERVGDTAETKPSGPPASKRRCEEECWVKEAEGFSRRRDGQAPWMPWKQQGERMLGGRRGIISHAKGCRGF